MPELLQPVAIEAQPYRSVAQLAPLLLWRSREAAAPVVLIAPALGTPAGVYRRLGECLAGLGAHAAVIEMRGIGNSPVRARRGLDWGYADLVDGEVVHALALLRAEFPTAPIHGLGHSLGGHAMLLHQARYPAQALAGIALVACGTPYWRCFPWPRRWILRGLGTLVSASSRVCGYYPGDHLGFGGRQSAHLMREWIRFMRGGRLDVLAWPDGEWRQRLRQLPLPIAALVVDDDHYAPASAVQHLLSLVGSSAPLERLAGEGSRGHFGWLRAPEPAARRVMSAIAPAG